MNALVKNHRRSIAFVLTCMLIHSASWAQPAADFTTSSQSGCSPLIVHFTDQSTGNPTQWKWDLGNGVTSTLQHPSATYFNPGSYTIKLVVKNNSGSDSVIKSQLITVYSNPVADFTSSDTMGCFPLAVQFSDQSFSQGSQINSWLWDFGDGSVSTQQNPSHVYTTAGQYNVTLKVTNNFGCSKAITRSQHITVTGGVNAAFTAVSTSFCTVPATVQFQNQTHGSGNSFTWDFGDGHTSNQQDPVHSYTSNGSYTVKLIARSPQGCTDTIVQTHFIQAGVQTSFSFSNNACTNQDIQFLNTSQPAPVATAWYFSDGTVLHTANAVKKFTSTGTYQVKLVNDYGDCKDSIIQQVNVSAKPTALFDAAKKEFCQPSMVYFQSQTIGAASYFWNFGDGTTSTEMHPVHFYPTTGNFDVTLIVSNASGCTDTLKKPGFISIRKPQITLTGLPATGCVPLTVKPGAVISSTEPVVTYLWKFGDGTTSNLPFPEHVYTTAGNYDITLIVSTASGCTDSIRMVNAVRTGNKPNAEFSAMPPEVCNLHPVYFTDNSSGNVDQWLWTFGDSLNSTEQNPVVTMDNIGIFDVTLVVWSNTCADTILKEDLIKVLPPISQFRALQDCDNKYTVSFVDHSIGATHVLWAFGDGTTSTERNVSHTYSSPGVYSVVFKVYNNNCWHIRNETITIIDEKANIIADRDTICKGETINFSSPGVNGSNIMNWNWNFGDGTNNTNAGSTQHVYKNAGTYQVILTIKDKNKCLSRDTMIIIVQGPTARFNQQVISSCFDNNQVQFNSTSISDGTHPIIHYQWNFGDGQFGQTDTMLHHYGAVGNYNVSLSVTDSRGCTHQVVKNAAVKISKPVAAFSSPDTLSCTGKNIRFHNSSSGNRLNYRWDFGDGNFSTIKNPVHIYEQTGVYTISLVVRDSSGCVDTFTRQQYIMISFPEARFIVSDSVGTCPPLMVNFTNQSSGFSSVEWLFGDGNASSLMNPSHFYNTPGTFFAKLIVTGPGKCSDTAVQKIIVKGPNGEFSYSPLSGCNPLDVSFTATTQNTVSFTWDFSDGTTMTGSNFNTSHVYTAPGDYIPRMILTDASGCNYPLVGKDTIRVYEVTPGFTMSTNSICNAGPVQFTNTSVSNDFVTSYQWNFGDGTTSTDKDPVHYYSQPGTYSVQLTAITRNGCSASIMLNDTIHVLPTPAASISSEIEACAPAVISFKGINEGMVNATSWFWDFNNGSTGNSQNPFFQNYGQPGNYTITAIATAANGCSDTAYKQVTIHSLPQTTAGPDLSVCKGESIQLQAGGASRYTWNSSSSLNCTDCPSPIASSSSTEEFIVTGYNEFGCQSRDTVMLTVHQPFHMQVSPGDTICVGSAVSLVATGADQYSWSPSTAVQHNLRAETIAYPTTSTTYTVIGKDNHDCFADTATVFIKVWPIPTVDAGADQVLVVGNALQLKAESSNDVTNWQWSHGGTLSCATCEVTLARPGQTTTYRVQVKNDGGCSASDDVTVNVICNNGNLFVPNTFSPNGDGVNDRFFPAGTGINRIKSFRVFNRWGEVVFEKRDFAANDASSGWDGLFRGQALSPDVYIWNCEVLCQNNEVLAFKGDVTLLR